MKRYLYISSILFVVLFAGLKLMLMQNSIYTFGIELQMEQKSPISFLYHDNGAVFSPNLSEVENQVFVDSMCTYTFTIDDERSITNIRFDLGEVSQNVFVKNISLSTGKQSVVFTADSILSVFTFSNSVVGKRLENNILNLTLEGNDGQIIMNDISPYLTESVKWKKLILLLSQVFLVNAIICLIIYFTRYLVRLKSNKQRKQGVFIFLFIILIGLPIPVQMFSETQYASEEENRLLSTMPRFSISHFNSLTKRFNSFYLDHFGLRNNMISTWSLFKYSVLSISAIPDRVMVGEDGYLFATYYNVVVNDSLFSSDEMQKIRTNIEERAIWLKSQGIKFYFVIPPSKVSIYPELMPIQFQRDHYYSKIDQMLVGLEGIDNLQIIDVREELLAAKAKGDLDIYYRSDTHWNGYGAFLAYQKIKAVMSRDFPELSPRPISEYKLLQTTDYEGDLYKSLGIKKFFRRYKTDMELINKVDTTLSDISMVRGIVAERYHTVNTTAPVLFMNRDSYAISLAPLLYSDFSRSLFLWTPDFIPELIEREKPDIYILERLEMFMNSFIPPNPQYIIDQVDSIRQSQTLAKDSLIIN